MGSEHHRHWEWNQDRVHSAGHPFDFVLGAADPLEAPKAESVITIMAGKCVSPLQGLDDLLLVSPGVARG